MTSKKIVPIKYTSRDFNTIKNDLVEYAKKYYPDTFKDFNQASFGSLMLDSVSYIGDILSFYLDYNANESHLKTSIEFNNILKHGYKLGYKYNPFAASSGIVTIYCLVPANATGLGPDFSYAPIIKKGTNFSSGTGIFTLTENVNMANSKFNIRVAKTDPDTGAPTFYAIKGYGSVISGIVKTETIAVGNFKRFLRIELADLNISEIISVFDSEGNEYYEVDYLSQNIIYKEVPNTAADSTSVTNILIPIAAPRRFTAETNNESTYLTFGAASLISVENDEMLEDPNNFVIQRYGKNFITDDSFDPNKLVNSDKFGLAPSNTTLTIEYRVNTVENVNAGVNAINEIADLKIEFINSIALDATKTQTVSDSIVVENEDPVVGYIDIPNSDELKIRILDNFASQNRAVTERDYEVTCYSMPPKFGAIKRAKIVRDQSSFKRNLNLYVVSEDSNGFLTQPSISLKKNLKTWLEKNKMISDTIDIIDGKVVNLEIFFTALSTNGASKSDVLAECVAALKKYFTRVPELGEPLMINNLLSVLKKIDTVLDVKEIKVMTKTGTNYSSTPLLINMSTNSPFYNPIVSVPLNVIWEIKYPDSDIRGTIL